MTDEHSTDLRKAQIGRCGELLVQLELLRRGVESAAMTTDSGIDLVAYSALNGRPATIQVKANLRAKPGGGKGRPALDWWVSEDCPAQLVALVDLSSSAIWLFSSGELREKAQQHSNGRHHLYMYIEPDYEPRSPMPSHLRDFRGHLLENALARFFGQSKPLALAGDSPE